MWRRWLVVIVATATILSAALWAELQYQPRISGDHQQQHHPSYAIGNSSQKAIFPAEFFVWIDDVVGWTDTHHDFVLAVANVFLAAFTLALFAATFGLLRFAKRQASDMESLLTAAHNTAAASASQIRAIEAQERVMREQAITMAANLDLTKRAADAAQATADAAISQARIMAARESPVFSWGGFELEPTARGIAVGGVELNIDYRPVAIIKNIGRSEMELRAFCIETILSTTLQLEAEPKYNTIKKVGIFIEADTEARLEASATIRFTQDEARALEREEMCIFIYGFARYFNRFTNEIGDVGFMVRRSRGRFVPYGSPDYNYYRRQNANSNDISIDNARTARLLTYIAPSPRNR